MADVRSRKPQAVRQSARSEDDKPKSKQPDLEPSFSVVLSLVAVLALSVSALFYYKIDNRSNGPFATWVNTHSPALQRALNQPRSVPLFGAYAQETTGELSLTEAELKAYDGTDSEKPIYLAINGTIFDVSSSPAFYGPGGHYHHFVGKDATRAWITECWDEDEQFTWRLDDVHVMFMPKYMDEIMVAVQKGETEGLDLGEGLPIDMLSNMAEKALERFGSPSKKLIAKRRVTDVEEAEAKVQETLTHWYKFFSENAKYKVVGTVVRDDNLPTPPKPCEAAMKKRPLKGGKLEGLMGSVGNLMGAGGASKGGSNKNREMPAFVKDKLAKEKKEKEEKEAKEAKVEVEEDDEDLVHDEL